MSILFSTIGGLGQKKITLQLGDCLDVMKNIVRMKHDLQHKIDCHKERGDWI